MRLRFTMMAELGWCGFGRSGGLVPELRLGLVRLAFCRGSLLERMRGWHEALRAARSMVHLHGPHVSAFLAESMGSRTGPSVATRRRGGLLPAETVARVSVSSSP